MSVSFESTSDAHWQVDRDAMEEAHAKRPKPWVAHERFFKEVRMSVMAAMKILIHAKSGQGKQGRLGRSQQQGGDSSNWVEVMGLMQGHFIPSEGVLVVTDAFALPVEASEVECSMSDASQAYMLNYLDHCRTLNRPDAGCVGWYHSHPGYSCFLSGIDVNTQRNNQMIADPWLAVVVDPVQSLATETIVIKAFRTLPESSVGPSTAATASGAAKAMDTSMVPMEKVAELGAHFNQYYELPITLFRSENDAAQLTQLKHDNWANALSQVPLRASTERFTISQLGNLIRGLKGDFFSKNVMEREASRVPPSWAPQARRIACEHIRDALTASMQRALAGFE